jgi:hypothetical protein
VAIAQRPFAERAGDDRGSVWDWDDSEITQSM